MATDLQTDLTTLIGKCECAIRRGIVPYPEQLHTLQQQLVTAQDAPNRTCTEEQLQTAIRYYVAQIPKDIRQSNLALFTDAFDQMCDSLNITVGRGDLSVDAAVDD